MSREFDIVVFGATGFTGKFVVEELARTEDEKTAVGKRWAIAGRNMSKLQGVLAEASKHTGMDLTDRPIIIADVSAPESLKEMAGRTRVVLNCVGPYQLWGDPVVRACVEAGASHLDVSGEPLFLENTQLVYHAKAREAGVYILGACGFDSIPCDMGVAFLREKFGGDLNHVEGYLGIARDATVGYHANIGTWHSAIEGFANADKLKAVRKSFNWKPLPKGKTRIPRRSAIFHSKDTNRWCLPFPGADRSVVNRSLRYLYEDEGERPLQFNAYFSVDGLHVVVYLVLLGLVFFVFSKFSMGRSLMVRYPKIFSLGMFENSGPSRKQMEGTSFTMQLVGQGYENKLADPTAEHEGSPTKKLVARVTGPELGYVTTPICLVQAAYTLLQEQDKMPAGGGVYSPGAAFSKTSLVSRLNSHGVKFEILSQ